MAPGQQLEYPPVAPIPAIRKKRTTSISAAKMSGQGVSHECPVNFIRPDLPSRCTWAKDKCPADSPHSKDAP